MQLQTAGTWDKEPAAPKCYWGHEHLQALPSPALHLQLGASAFRGLRAIEHKSCEDLEIKIFDLPEQKGLTDTNQGL